MAVISVIGPKGSGKTHFLALLYLHITRKAMRRGLRRHSVLLDPEGGGVDISEMAAFLQEGESLPPDRPGMVSKTKITTDRELSLPWWLRLGTKASAEIPLVDSSGEAMNWVLGTLARTDGNLDFEEMAQQYFANPRTNNPLSKADYADIFGQLFTADAYVLIFNLEEAFQRNQLEPGGLEAMPSATGQISYARYFRALCDYRTNHGIGPPKSVAWVFTKFDEVQDHLPADLPPDPTGEQLVRYLAPFAFHEVSGRVGQPSKLEAFASYTRIDPETGRFRVNIDTVAGMRIPDYPEQTYEELVKWLLAF